MTVLIEKKDQIWTIIINRPEVRNAVNGATAQRLADAFREFDADESAAVAILTGAGEYFCAGADLKAVAGRSEDGSNRMDTDMSADGPMGPSRMYLSKPVLAAVAGYAVAGGLELACWCDLRVVEKTAVFGVYCRRYGVPLIDGGTQRLPRLIGMSRAMDMILTGRSVHGEEALTMGLANYLVEPGTVREEAEKVARKIAAYPQICMRSDRDAAYRGFDLPFDQAMTLEFKNGMQVIQSGETVEGAIRFTKGLDRELP
jgi:enoyl-CoA hydratase